MIHPSTMAGPNWFTGSFGTTNPFQQNTSFFRNTPFGGQQGGFGPGINPFQSQPMGFGTTTMQLQNTINEIVRQTVPTILANCGIQPNNVQGTFGFQTGINPGQIGFTTPFGFQTPIGPAQFGPQFQSSTWAGPSPFVTDYQNQIQNQAYVAEMIRQATNQAIQSLTQQIPGIFTQGLSWQGTAFQPYSGIGTMAFTGPQNAFTTQLLMQQQQQQQQQQQHLWNLVNQVSQAVAQCVLASLTQQNQTQSTPYNLNIGSPQSSVTPGIPTGAGVF